MNLNEFLKPQVKIKDHFASGGFLLSSFRWHKKTPQES